MRAANTRTFFGQIWLVLNPLLLAAVYFVLLIILAPRDEPGPFFAHLSAGLFAFYYISGALTTGAGRSSVVVPLLRTWRSRGC